LTATDTCRIVPFLELEGIMARAVEAVVDLSVLTLFLGALYIGAALITGAA
jgi:hypothetical protein